jgi:hypothetical protein
VIVDDYEAIRLRLEAIKMDCPVPVCYGGEACATAGVCRARMVKTLLLHRGLHGALKREIKNE